MLGNELSDEPAFVAFFDEAGDPGIRKVAPATPGGASEWFVMAAVVLRIDQDLEAVRWVKDLRFELNALQGPALHFRKLSPAKRLRAAEFLATKPVRIFVVVSNKLNMEAYRNVRAEKQTSQEWFYNWCTRLLLERVTNFCLDRGIQDYGRARKVRLEFSRRGGLRYTQMMAYHKFLEMQDRTPQGMYLATRRPAWEVMSWDHFHHYPDHERAGLQLADIAASAFYQAVETRGRNWSLDCAKALGPRLGRKRHRIENEGLTLLPFPSQGRNLSAEQMQIFEYFGFR